MTDVEEINGQASASQPAAGMVPPPPPAPPRVCFGEQHTINSPVQNYTEVRTLCGKTPRDKMDQVAFDRNDVTCDDCKKRLHDTGEGEARSATPMKAVGAALPSLETSPPALTLAGLLGVESCVIGERIATVQGELAGLKVLYAAALAREKASKPPVPRKRRRRARPEENEAEGS